MAYVKGMAENVDITLLAKICQDNLAEARATRRELAGVQQLAINTVDALVKMEQRNDARFAAINARFSAIDDRFGMIDTRFAAVDSRFVSVDARLREIDQRVTDLKNELRLVIKSEMTSVLGNFEGRIMGLIEERLTRRD
jgi:archaellum component FlaC